MKLKPVFLLFCLLAASLTSMAQQRPVFSQYMFNGLVLNPAYAGNQPQTSVSLLYRNQWINVAGAPRTATLIAHTAFKDLPIGTGFLLSRDQIGVHDDYSIYSSYAYKLKLRVGTLAMGLQAGFNYTISDFTKPNIVDQDDPNFGYRLTNFSPNFGTGAFYSTEKSYAGISIPYIINNKLKGGESLIEEARRKRYYFVTGGHVFTLKQGIKIKPSTLLRFNEGAPVGYDLNANVFLQDVVNVGVSYRSNDAVIMLFEIILNQNITFGYAYDRTLSKIVNYTDGTHELMLTYRRSLGKGPCHAYF